MAANLPLAGLRVIETCEEKGELCGRLLADLGADVVKVEPPGGAPPAAVRARWRDEPVVRGAQQQQAQRRRVE
jgi:crotonobetainyl-CoA:carnitine CoA-transferase CaiB-like acyl-CoA transferase